MVTKEEYKNNSYVIREALIRLMNEKDGALSGTGAIDVESESQLDLSSLLPKLSASLLVSIRKGDSKTEKKINKLEVNYHDTIIHKTCFSIEDFKTITYILDDNLPVIHARRIKLVFLFQQTIKKCIQIISIRIHSTSFK